MIIKPSVGSKSLYQQSWFDKKENALQSVQSAFPCNCCYLARDRLMLNPKELFVVGYDVDDTIGVLT